MRRARTRRTRFAHRRAPDTPERIARDAFAETLVVDVAAVGVGGEPLAGGERVAAGTMESELAVRTAKVRPSAATSTSGTGVRAASTSASTAKAAPLQRSDVLRSPMTRRPAVANRRGPVPNDVTRPKAPGKLATHKATISIHSMP